MNQPKAKSSIFMGVLGFLLMLVAVGPALKAQHIRGALEGSVKDPNGAIVQGATVTLRNSATGREITATTNDEGRFGFQNVEPGTYTVNIEKAGFRSYQANDVTVKVGSVTPLLATLEIGQAKE